MKSSLKILIASLCFLNACAPQVHEREFAPPKNSFGPRSQDKDLSTSLEANARFDARVSWKGLVGSATYFEQAENLVRIGELSGNKALSHKGLEWIKYFYKQPKTSTYVSLEETPFATLAAAQTQEEVQKSLTEVGQELDESRALLRQYITSLGQKFPWSEKPQHLGAALQQAQDFIQLIVNELPNMGLSPMIEEGVRDELKAQAGPLFMDARPLVEEFYGISSFPEALKLLEAAIAQFEIELTPELAKSLQDGNQIAYGLRRMNEPQRALTVLIDVWRMLTPEEREQSFKSASEDLYDFLSKQDDKELSCLRRDGCNGGLFKGIAKKFFILPELKKHGVEKLKKDLNKQTLAYVTASLETTAHQMMGPALAETIAVKIEQGLQDKATELKDVQTNYITYLRTLLGDWSKRVLPELKGQVPGFEISALKVDISNESPMSLQAVGSALELRAHTAGASMAANALLMQNAVKEDTFGVQSALSQLNKLITIGGYRDHDNNLIPALLSPVEQILKPLDIMSFSSIRHSYRIPDKIRMQDAFHIDRKIKYDKNFSASAFAEQIRGLSQMLHVTADWKKTGYDELLGHVNAQDLTDKIQSDSLARSLFPKDMFFALNLGDVAVLLQDITKQSTPVFLLTLDKKIMWADEYAESKDTAIMAGIVDIKDGKRSNVVRSQDVAKFLLSLFEFLKATEGSENTQSSLLLEKDTDNKTAIDTLKEGRSDLKLLVLALGNFISNQLMSKKAMIPANYYLNEQERANDPDYTVEEQVYAIRALLAAWKTTKIDVYMWSAQEIYYAMNKNLYSEKEHFYINGDGTSLDFPQKTNTILALLELAPHLPEASRFQLQALMSPWILALDKLK
ncbi:hypothetical protein D3C87_105290 [compost metagenome]